MKKERIKAHVSDLVLNEGQISWLPKNPRQWTQTDIDRTKQSLERDSDFHEDRPVLVVRYEDKLLVFGGNLRTTAAKSLRWKTIDAICYTPECEEDKEVIKRRAILDNGSFGEWDVDALANEWDDLPLDDWGVVADWGEAEENVKADDFGEEFSLPSGDKQPFQQMTFTLADMQAAEIKEAIEEVKGLEAYKTMITFGNSNSNGNAIALIVEQWIESRR